MFGGVLDDGNVAHGGAAFGGKSRAFDRQVLDQHHGVAVCQWDAVCIAMTCVLDHTRLGPRTGVIVEVEHVVEVPRPVVGFEAIKHAGSNDLDGGVFGPHGGREAAPMGWIRLALDLRGTGVAELDRGAVWAARDGGVSEGRVGRADRASHGRAFGLGAA